MAASIFPDPVTGAGVVIRDDIGVCLNPPDVTNAYCPAPEYVITCPPTALPANCEARIEAGQINAIVSELLSFAECLDPDGPWDCTKLNNLCASFQAWAAINLDIVHVGDDPPATPLTDQLWFESDTGMLFVYYNDGSGTQWVQCGGVGNTVVDGVSIVGNGTAANPHSVQLVDCGEW